jgi:hypothetical protein
MSGERVFRFGELTAIEAPPALQRAICAIAYIHVEFDKHATRGISRSSCIACATIVTQFLQKIGFDAVEASVANIAEDKKFGDSVAIGIDMKPDRREWPGHLITIVRDHDYLIDTTLYHLYPTWQGPRGMVCGPLTKEEKTVNGMKVIASLSNSEFRMVWTDRQDNIGWRKSSAARDHAVRSKVVAGLIERHRDAHRALGPVP